MSDEWEAGRMEERKRRTDSHQSPPPPISAAKTGTQRDHNDTERKEEK